MSIEGEKKDLLFEEFRRGLEKGYYELKGYHEEVSDTRTFNAQMKFNNYFMLLVEWDQARKKNKK